MAKWYKLKFDILILFRWSNCTYIILKFDCFFLPGLPAAPKNCTLYNQSSGSAEVGCISGYDGGLPQHFLLELFAGRSRLARWDKKIYIFLLFIIPIHIWNKSLLPITFHKFHRNYFSFSLTKNAITISLNFHHACIYICNRRFDLQ